MLTWAIESRHSDSKSSWSCSITAPSRHLEWSSTLTFTNFLSGLHALLSPQAANGCGSSERVPSGLSRTTSVEDRSPFRLRCAWRPWAGLGDSPCLARAAAAASHLDRRLGRGRDARGEEPRAHLFYSLGAPAVTTLPTAGHLCLCCCFFCRRRRRRPAILARPAAVRGRGWEAPASASQPVPLSRDGAVGWDGDLGRGGLV